MQQEQQHVTSNCINAAYSMDVISVAHVSIMSKELACCPVPDHVGRTSLLPGSRIALDRLKKESVNGLSFKLSSSWASGRELLSRDSICRQYFFPELE